MSKNVVSHPDPEPPTIAIFLPAGTVKLMLSKIRFSGVYEKQTLLKVIVASSGVTLNGMAFGAFCKDILNN